MSFVTLQERIAVLQVFTIRIPIFTSFLYLSKTMCEVREDIVCTPERPVFDS